MPAEGLPTPPVLRVAVVGSGITGLSAASYLYENVPAKLLQMTVYERGSHVGGHAHTQYVNGVAVDTGFMVFNAVTYPNMINWFNKYDVDMEQSDMSLSISVDGGSLEWSSDGLDGLFAQRSNIVNPSFLQMIRDISRFEGDVLNFLSTVECSNEDSQRTFMMQTMREFLDCNHYSDYFIRYYLLPVCGSVWSCPTATSMEFPAYFILTFMRNHHLLQLTNRPQWLTVSGRSQNGYVQKVIKNWSNCIKLNCGVRNISVSQSQGTTTIDITDDSGTIETYDYVIFATHAPDTLNILGQSASAEEKSVLGAFEYQSNEVVLHRDKSLMPQSKRCWSSWNFMGETVSRINQETKHVESPQNKEECNSQAKVDSSKVETARISLTYWLNRLQNLEEEAGLVLVTLNPITQPAESLTVSKTIMSHPVPSVRSYIAMSRLPSIQGVRHMYFAGAWSGFGFHEDGFKSGQSAAHACIRHFASYRNIKLVSDKLQNVYCPLPNVISFNNQLSIFNLTIPAKSLVFNFFSTFVKKGYLSVREHGGSVYNFGRRNATFPAAILHITSATFYVKVAFRADLGFADAYEEGFVESPDILQFLKLLIVNRDVNQQANKGRLYIPSLFSSVLTTSASYLYQAYTKRNTPAQAKQNIHDHYDLGNGFFKLFLDDTMAYSCGIFHSPKDTLYDAQMNKLNALVEKANITKEHNVLEIGFGWGALSLLIADRYGCRVTGITLSEEQLDLARQLSVKRGLDHLVDFLLIDYRVYAKTNAQSFDRILSCEMLEAVGHEFLGDFYQSCDELLAPNGLLVVQVITFPDNKYDEYRTNVDFIREKIFPGGICPSLHALTNAMQSRSSFLIESLENIGIHYAKTLSMWRENLRLNRERAKQEFGFSDIFLNRWDYYFVYCEAGFLMRCLNVLHIVYTRTGNNISLDKKME